MSEKEYTKPPLLKVPHLFRVVGERYKLDKNNNLQMCRVFVNVISRSWEGVNEYIQQRYPDMRIHEIVRGDACHYIVDSPVAAEVEAKLAGESYP